MKESRHLLLPLATLFTLVIGFSGCITQAIVKVEPSEVKIGETLTVSYIFRNYELVGELNVAKITVNVYHNGIHTDSYTLNHTSPGWKTSYVSLFQEAEIYSSTQAAQSVGDWELRVTLHTKRLEWVYGKWFWVPYRDFKGKGRFTVLP